jgi:hypothetical protein
VGPSGGTGLAAISKPTPKTVPLGIPAFVDPSAAPPAARPAAGRSASTPSPAPGAPNPHLASAPAVPVQLVTRPLSTPPPGRHLRPSSSPPPAATAAASRRPDGRVEWMAIAGILVALFILLFVFFLLVPHR